MSCASSALCVWVTVGPDLQRLFGELDEDNPEPCCHMWPGLCPDSESHLTDPQKNGGPQVSWWVSVHQLWHDSITLLLNPYYLTSHCSSYTKQSIETSLHHCCGSTDTHDAIINTPYWQQFLLQLLYNVMHIAVDILCIVNTRFSKSVSPSVSVLIRSSAVPQWDTGADVAALVQTWERLPHEKRSLWHQ